MGRYIINWWHAYGLPKINLEYFPSIYIYDILFGAFYASWSMFEAVGINGVWALHVGKYYTSNLHEIDLDPLHWYLIYHICRRWCDSPALSHPLPPRSGGGATAVVQPDGGRVGVVVFFFCVKQFRKQVAIAFVEVEMPPAKIIF